MQRVRKAGPDLAMVVAPISGLLLFGKLLAFAPEADLMAYKAYARVRIEQALDGDPIRKSGKGSVSAQFQYATAFISMNSYVETKDKFNSEIIGAAFSPGKPDSVGAVDNFVNVFDRNVKVYKVRLGPFDEGAAVSSVLGVADHVRCSGEEKKFENFSNMVEGDRIYFGAPPGIRYNLLITKKADAPNRFLAEMYDSDGVKLRGEALYLVDDADGEHLIVSRCVDFGWVKKAEWAEYRTYYIDNLGKSLNGDQSNFDEIMQLLNERIIALKGSPADNAEIANFGKGGAAKFFVVMPRFIDVDGNAIIPPESNNFFREGNFAQVLAIHDDFVKADLPGNYRYLAMETRILASCTFTQDKQQVVFNYAGLQAGEVDGNYRPVTPFMRTSGITDVAQMPKDVKVFKLSIYPNPVMGDKAVLRMNNPKEGEIGIGIYDLLGLKIMETRRYLRAGVGEVYLDGLGGLKPGTYFLHAYSSAGEESAKLSIAR